MRVPHAPLPPPGPDPRAGRRRVATCLAAAASLLLLCLQLPAGAQGPAAPVAELRVPFPQEDGSLTPYTFELGYPLVTLVYDTLLWRDAAGTAQPWLARSVDTAADGRRVTVRLPPEARWHDGRALTSADVAFTFGYVKRRPHPRFSPQVQAVDRVETPDAHTAVFVLRSPSPGFADQPLADVPILPAHLWRVVPDTAIAPEGLPVGSGPYRLVAHEAGRRYRFEANADYFRGAPAVGAIEVPIITEAAATFTALARRAVDMVPASVAPRDTRDVGGIGTRITSGPGYVATVLLLNVRRPPFDRPEVRQAVARAIDVRAIAEVVRGATAATTGFVHPASTWAPDDEVPTAGGTTGVPLRSMGLAPVEVLVADNDPVKLDAGRQVVAALDDAGVAVSLRRLSQDELSAAVGEDGSTPSFGAAIWTAPSLSSYDPDFLRSMFTTRPGSLLNHSGYSSPAFDDLADRVATTADPAARLGAVRDELVRLAADAPAVPLFFAAGNFAYRPAAFDGWVFVKGTGILDKRSFVEPVTTPAPTTVPGPEEPIETSDPGLSLAGWAAITVAALAGMVAVAGVVRGRR